jgi:hypothetical protein
MDKQTGTDRHAKNSAADRAEKDAAVSKARRFCGVHLERLPQDREGLRAWIHLHTGLLLPMRATCPGHQTPLDYLAHSFLEELDAPTDAAVWACRGGGKTMTGALATLLDLVFKPGIQVRILGGSLEQSDKMYAYLRRLFEGNLAPLLRRAPMRRRLELRNGSAVEVLAQSDTSVRGTRVQKLRCDEAELFDPDVWKAAQLTTRSMEVNAKVVRGSIDVLSTMHRPGGLMQDLLTGKDASDTRRVFAWCIWDVVARCHEDRKCAKCPLWADCGGRAKEGTGFVPVEDVIGMHARVSRSTWEHEMLCLPPRPENGVFSAFRRELHVSAWPGPRGARLRAGRQVIAGERGWMVVEALVAGVDFGYVGAFVCLWVAMLRDAAGRRVVWIVDELVTRQRTLAANVRAMKAAGAEAAGAAAMEEERRGWRPDVVCCDVAGRGPNSQTGRPDESLLRDEGFKVRSASMRIEEGVALLNEMIDPANSGGGVRLLIDPKCVRLIAAMEGYARKKGGEIAKDGVHDHLIDALRYAVVNVERPGGKLIVRAY